MFKHFYKTLQCLTHDHNISVIEQWEMGNLSFTIGVEVKELFAKKQIEPFSIYLSKYIQQQVDEFWIKL